MKNVVITGTSRGIGYELAQQFANNGHQVLALSRNTEPLSEINHKNIKREEEYRFVNYIKEQGLI